MDKEEKFYRASLSFAFEVHETVDPSDANPNVQLAYTALEKCVQLGEDIWKLVELDYDSHAAICSITRSIIDTTTFGFYLLEKPDADEARLRYLLIRLNNIQSKISMIRVMKGVDTKPHKKERLELIESLKENKIFNHLHEDKQKDFLRGYNPFLHGRKQAAINAGWDVDAYSATYSMLSDYAHSNPMSLIDRANTAVNDDHAWALIGVTLLIAGGCVSTYARKILTEFPIVESSWNQEQLKAVDTFKDKRFVVMS